jgi:hypothetical protein
MALWKQPSYAENEVIGRHVSDSKALPAMPRNTQIEMFTYTLLIALI